VSAPPGVRDVFSETIRAAVVDGVREAMNVDEATNRRLLSAEEAATYLNLSRREIYNMVANKDLRAVKHGKRTMFDIRDLNEWIEAHKV